GRGRDEADREGAADREARRGEAEDPARPEVAIALVVGRDGARGDDGRDEAADDRLREPGEGPDCRDRDGAGADEAHLPAPDEVYVVGERNPGRRGGEG